MCGLTIFIIISLCSLFCAGKQGDIQPTEDYMNRTTLTPGPSCLGVDGNITTTHKGFYESGRMFLEIQRIVADHLRKHLTNSKDICEAVKQVVHVGGEGRSLFGL